MLYNVRMKNKILILAGVVIILGGLYWTNTRTSQKPEEAAQIKDSAWNVFEQYLSDLKAHNLTDLKTITYKLSGTCTDSTKTAECFGLMDKAYNAIKDFSKDEFIQVSFDSKQIILSTDFRTIQDGNARILIREIIYFYRDSASNPKVIAYTLPFEQTFITIDFSQKLATSTIDSRLNDRVKDTDGDYLPDEIENCAFAEASSSCIKTNPNKKDSKGDGWWDGVRIFISN